MISSEQALRRLHSHGEVKSLIFYQCNSRDPILAPHGAVVRPRSSDAIRCSRRCALPFRKIDQFVVGVAVRRFVRPETEGDRILESEALNRFAI